MSNDYTTANEDDVRRANDYHMGRLGDDLAAQFAAVRAPLEARIAELEAENACVMCADRIARIAEMEKLLDQWRRGVDRTIPLMQAANDRMRGELTTAREAALREAAEVCKQAAMSTTYNEHERSAALFRAEAIILALIEAPAVKA